MAPISHPWSFCVAGVALMALGGALGPAWSRVTPRHCAWQAWHLVTSTLNSRGRRGTISHPQSGALGPACVARDAAALLHGTGVAHLVTSTLISRGRRVHNRGTFAWQAWHLVTSTLISRGRLGTNSHPRSFCVAGVAGVALMVLGGALGPAWLRVTLWHFCVAGVALGDIHLDFTWQAWHNLTSRDEWRWVARLGPLGRA